MAVATAVAGQIAAGAGASRASLWCWDRGDAPVRQARAWVATRAPRATCCWHPPPAVAPRGARRSATPSTAAHTHSSSCPLPSSSLTALPSAYTASWRLQSRSYTSAREDAHRESVCVVDDARWRWQSGITRARVYMRILYMSVMVCGNDDQSRIYRDMRGTRRSVDSDDEKAVGRMSNLDAGRGLHPCVF